MLRALALAAFVICIASARAQETQHDLSSEEMRLRAQTEQPLYDMLDNELRTVGRNSFENCFKIIRDGQMKAEMDYTFVRPYAVLWEKENLRGCFIGKPRKNNVFPATVDYLTVAVRMTPVDCLLKALSCLKPEVSRKFSAKYGRAIDPTPFYK